MPVWGWELVVSVSFLQVVYTKLIDICYDFAAVGRGGRRS